MGVPVQTKQDLSFVKTHTLYLLAFESLDEDIKNFKPPIFKFAHVYTELLRQIQDKIAADDFQLRIKLKRSGIKILKIDKQEKGVSTEYLCRGYLHNCTLTWRFARAEVSQCIFRYAYQLTRKEIMT